MGKGASHEVKGLESKELMRLMKNVVTATRKESRGGEMSLVKKRIHQSGRKRYDNDDTSALRSVSIWQGKEKHGL